MMSNPILMDFYERDLVEGQIIAYPVRQGSNLWIEKALITEVCEDFLKVEKANGSKTRIKNYQNCFVAPRGVRLDD